MSEDDAEFGQSMTVSESLKSPLIVLVAIISLQSMLRMIMIMINPTTYSQNFSQVGQPR